MSEVSEIYKVGDRTAELVFRSAGITDLSDLQKVLDQVEVALKQAPRVKRLVWKIDDNRTAYAQRQYFADRYCIEHRLHGDDAFDLWIGPDAVKATRHATIEAAKAAAQADYEAGILAALE